MSKVVIMYNLISYNSCFSKHVAMNSVDRQNWIGWRCRYIILWVVSGAYVTEADVGTYTIEAVNDPNTLNKAVHIRLPANYLSLNETVSLWEKKIGKSLEKIYVPEEEVLEKIQGQ